MTNAKNVLIVEGAEEIKVGGVTIKVAGGAVEIFGGLLKQQPSNDTAIAAAKAALEIGDKMADGSIYAGLTADGKSQIYAMPTDLDVTMTFNNAAKAVDKLNSQKALGHDDWQIGDIGVMRVLYQNQEKGSLKGTFNPDWYCSSTEHRAYSSCVHAVCFSGGYEAGPHKDDGRLSCRPVRIVPVAKM